MLGGCIFYSLFLVLLFYPPGLNDSTKINFIESYKTTLWFGIFYVLFFISDTICNIPYGALAPELSINPKQREKIYLYYYIFQYLGILFSVTGPVILQYFLFNKCNFSICEGYKNNFNSYSLCLNLTQQNCNNKNNFDSIKSIAIYLAIHYIVSVVLVYFSITENPDNVKNRHGAIPSLFNMLKNIPFKKIIKPYILDNIILSIFSTMIPFYIKYVINPEEHCAEKNISLKIGICNSNIL
jgi:Na+/melibiose symporter-like transporter